MINFDLLNKYSLKELIRKRKHGIIITSLTYNLLFLIFPVSFFYLEETVLNSYDSEILFVFIIVSLTLISMYPVILVINLLLLYRYFKYRNSKYNPLKSEMSDIVFHDEMINSIKIGNFIGFNNRYLFFFNKDVKLPYVISKDDIVAIYSRRCPYGFFYRKRIVSRYLYVITSNKTVLTIMIDSKYIKNNGGLIINNNVPPLDKSIMLILIKYWPSIFYGFDNSVRSIINDIYKIKDINSLTDIFDTF